jgi:DNA-directed RNA polymerase subunit M/transcription elongation factor TFIIS
VERAIPESPDSENAGASRSGEFEYGTIWSQQYGAKCPRCGQFQKTAYKHSPWRDGRKTRYNLCPGCGYRFKSIAVDSFNFSCPPAPDTLVFLRKYGK